MGKNIKWIAPLLAILWSSAANAAEDHSMLLGNGQNKSVTMTQVSNGVKAGAALHYPAETMQTFSGCCITELHIDINKATGKDSLRVFITRNLQDEPLYEQRYTVAQKGWQTLVLEQPFAIDGSELFIGYEVEGQRYLQYSNRIVDGFEEWIRHKSDGWKKYTDLYSASMYAVVSGEQLPERNIVLQHCVLPAYTKQGEEMVFKGSFFNMASTAVNSLDIEILDRGEVVETVNVETIQTEPRQQGSFQIAGGASLAAGSHELQLHVKAVNGRGDLDDSNNYSRTTSLLCCLDLVPRNILLEVFSTEKCTNCPSKHEVITKAMASKENVIEVVHHAGFYDDQFTVDASREYEWFYQKDRLYAPAVMMDRTALTDNHPDIFTEQVAIFSPSTSTLETVYAEQNATPAYAHIQLSGSYDSATRTLSMDVKGSSIEGMPLPDSLRLNLFLTEDSLFTMTQAGATGNYYHRHSLRQCVTPTWGEAIEKNAEGGFETERHYEVTLPENWNEQKMEMVAFISAANTSDNTQAQVLNSCSKSVEEVIAAGISSPCAEREANGLKRPVCLEGTLSLPEGRERITLFDLSGRKITELNKTRPHTHMARGIYLMQ